MAINRANGGLVGKSNKASGGGNAVTRFNASGTFTAQKNTTAVDVLTVAGAGGGGNTSGEQGGGGGAGGFRNLTSETIVPGGSIPITVGAGGAVATAGVDSVFANPINPITSDSGGLGGSGGNPAPGPAAGTGGSGGGGGWNQTGAAGNTPPTSPAQGTAGGNGQITNVSNMRGGAGGGGAGATATIGVGDGSSKGPTNQAGHGGSGAPSTVTGTNTLYAGGGGGGALNSTSSWATKKGAGRNGGGAGAEDGTAAVAGTANTGGGGGGASGSATNAAAGGSGVVIVKELDKAQGVFDMKSQYITHTKGQWPTRTGPDEIGNSLRSNDDDNPRLIISHDAAGNRKTFTISAWVKYGKCPQFSYLAGTQTGGDDYCQIGFADNGQIRIFQGDGSVRVATKALFRDPSAWYHLVFAIDTTDGTASNRVKIYINGTQQDVCRPEAFTTAADYPSQNLDLFFNNTDAMGVGVRGDGDNSSFDGYMSEFYFIDGQALHAGHFGEPDPDCPQIWRPKTYRGTYGTNGFHLEFKQSGVGSGSTSTVGADTSGNLNHFTSTNIAATDQSTDTPTNNFCTLNPLQITSSSTLSEGNTKHTNDGANDQAVAGTMGFANGKWYWEIKCVDKGEIGINLDSNILQLSNDSAVGSNDANIKATSLITNSAGGSNDLRHNGSTESITSVSVSDGDIISIAVDADNGKIWFGKAGTWMGSGDPAAGSNESKDFSGAYTSGNFITPVATLGTGDGDILEFNFGNPPHSISSGNADANGYGNFEYAVPSGYYALCSKNLAQYG